VEETGIVAAFEAQASGGARMRIACKAVMDDLAEGASVAVNGVCLTAVRVEPGSFGADLAPETMRRTNLGDLAAGSLVNLERPLLPTGRLSGHIVQGHVDGTGDLMSFEELGDGNWWLKIRVPQELDRWLVYKGSVAVDGISLTVASIENGVLGITIIPHTYEMTRLREYRPGARVNIECDILAKHVDKLMALRSGAAV
jgi:riboflavin synthase